MIHLVIDYLFVCDLVKLFELRVGHVFDGDQLADALTKSLSQHRLFYWFYAFTSLPLYWYIYTPHLSIIIKSL